MKLLIINLHSSHNAGDHVLLLVGLQQLYAQFPGCQITLAMNDPASYRDRADAGDEVVVDSFFAWFKVGNAAEWGSRLRRWWILLRSLWIALCWRWFGIDRSHSLPPRARATVQAYLQADLIVSCAGNFLYSRGHMGGLPLLGPVFTIAYAWLANKPIVMLPQTIGPLWRSWERWVVRWLLGRVLQILLRDPTSAALLAQMGIPATRYTVAPDIAFSYTHADATAARQVLARYGFNWEQPKPCLGVTLINWQAQHPLFTDQTRYEAAVAAAIHHFVEQYDGYAVLFAQVCGPTPADDDRVPARRVQALLAATPCADRVLLIDEEVPAAILKAAYGRMDLFLGSRLHSNIFALTEEVPVLAIAYQTKTVGVLQTLDLAQWVIPIEATTAERLIPLLEQLWAERATVHAQIQTRLPILQAEIRQAMARLRRS